MERDSHSKQAHLNKLVNLARKHCKGEPAEDEGTIVVNNKVGFLQSTVLREAREVAVTILVCMQRTPCQDSRQEAGSSSPSCQNFGVLPFYNLRRIVTFTDAVILTSTKNNVSTVTKFGVL
jgi:hypothetical protein